MCSRISHLLLSLLCAVAALFGPELRAADACPNTMNAWWKFESNGSDTQGASSLTLNGGASFASAQVGQGLFLDGANDYARANAASALNIGTSSGMTIEMWLKPANAAKVAAIIVEWNNGSIGAHLAISTAATRDLYANLVDTAGVSHQISSGANMLADNVFQHVALTYERTSGLAAMYINGNRVAQTNLGIFTPQTSFPFYVGVRPSGPFQNIYFPGVIDELSLYARALSQAEFQAIHAAGTAGKCATPQPLAINSHPQGATVQESNNVTFTVVAQGTAPLQYQWYFEGQALAGRTQSSLTLSNVTLANDGDYFAVVSDVTGSVTSSVARLTVVTPLGIRLQPRSLTTAIGSNATFSVAAQGSGTLTYRWYFNGSLVDGAATSNLVIAAAQPANAGRYFLTVSNISGTVTSATAVLNVLPHWGPVIEFVKDTKFSTNRGFFYAPFDLTIDCATPGATIVYTTNGNEPALGSGVSVSASNATSPPRAVIRIGTTTILRAAAHKDGFVSTGIDTHTYVFPTSVVNQVRPPGASDIWIEDPPGSGTFPADFTVTASVVNNALPTHSFTNALVSIPTISLVSPMDGLFGPSNGIYTRPLMEGTNWERAVSLELIYPDGREGFHVRAGAQMHGDVSALPHTIPKHPLRLFFRAKYGPTKLQYALFPGGVNRFDQLILRGCSTDAWPISNDVDFLWRNQDATYQRDQWMRDAQLDMGHLSARGVYMHLYLNGLYWGLYNLTERINDSFAADHLGGRKEDYDVIQGEFNGNLLHVTTAGTDAAWNQLLQVADQVPGNPAKFWEIQGLNPDGTRNPNLPVWLDLDNFIDYMLLHIYAAAVEWPNRNWWAVRKRDTGQLDSTGFKFLAWDQEIAIDRLDRTITWYNNAPFEQVSQADTPAQVYDRLRNHAEFKLRFGDRLQKHLFNGGALTIVANRARWASRAAEIDHAMVGESARWGDAKRSPAYTREADWLRMSNFTQNTYWPSNETLAWRRFRNVGLYPSVGAPTFNQFGGNVPADFQLTLSHTNAAGTILYTLDGTDPRAPGGANSGTALTYSQPIAIGSPTLVRARVKNGTNWSAIVEAQFFPPQDLSKLQLSEIMYNPPKSGAVDGEEFEFLELKNTGTNALDLSGLTFTRGITFTFSNETLLAPGAHFVLARNAAQFAARYSNAPLHGIYTGKLDNNGETLALTSSLGAPIFSVTYDNAAPWPAEADNSGLSLQRMSFTLPATDTASWVAAPPTPGGALPVAWMDDDADGLPNGWEQNFGFVLGINEANLDSDGDGLTNFQEFITGTNPRAATDALRLTAQSATLSGNLFSAVLGFEARSNKTYSVVYSDTIDSVLWTTLLHVNAEGTNRFVTVTDGVSTSARTRFYRLASPRLP